MVTVRVDIADAMLARARRVVLLVALLLNCENGPSLWKYNSYVYDEMLTFFFFSRGGFGRGRGAAPPS